MRADQKMLLTVMGAVEAATGLTLLSVPSVLVELLLGSVLDTPAGVTVGRVAGAAVLALGIVCWLARENTTGSLTKALVAAMLVYNVTVTSVLILAWMNQGLSGIFLWPVVLAHIGLAIWCIACLAARSVDE